MHHSSLPILLLISLMTSTVFCQNHSEKLQGGSVAKNEMKVSWQFEGGHIVFELAAPSKGWLAIGFNETPALPATYLLMAAVTKGKTKAIEFKTIAPGDYRPITELGGKASISVLEGRENQQGTMVRVRVPQLVPDGFHKNLLPGSKSSLLLAFSREDDFQHHSMMRTSIPITL